MTGKPWKLLGRIDFTPRNNPWTLCKYVFQCTALAFRKSDKSINVFPLNSLVKMVFRLYIRGMIISSGDSIYMKFATISYSCPFRSLPQYTVARSRSAGIYEVRCNIRTPSAVVVIIRSVSSPKRFVKPTTCNYTPVHNC